MEKDKSGNEVAKVANARLDTCNRQVLEDEDFEGLIELSKIRDHFLFTVESVCYLRPDELVVEALNVLSDKCDALIHFLESCVFSALLKTPEIAEISSLLSNMRNLEAKFS